MTATVANFGQHDINDTTGGNDVYNAIATAFIKHKLDKVGEFLGRSFHYVAGNRIEYLVDRSGGSLDANNLKVSNPQGDFTVVTLLFYRGDILSMVVSGVTKRMVADRTDNYKQAVYQAAYRAAKIANKMLKAYGEPQ